MTEGRSTVIDILTEDHREIEAMFAELESSETSDDRRADLIDRVIIELVRHSVAEEEYLYPAAREYLPGGRELAEREVGEHAEAERTMKQLELARDEIHVSDLLGQLISTIRQHVREEEKGLFPQLAEHVDERTLLDLGDRVAKAKSAAPTRPHPNAPTERPALLKAAAPGAGLVDRARDALTGRGRA